MNTLSDTGQEDLSWVEGTGTYNDNPEEVSQAFSYLNDIESDSDDKDEENSQLSPLDIIEPKEHKEDPTDLVLKSNGRGWLLTPIYAKWQQLTKNNNKAKEIRSLVFAFYKKLKAINGGELVPADVTAVLELILGRDVDLTGTGTTSSVKEESFGRHSNPMGFLKPFLRLKSETDELRRVLDGVVQLLVDISEITLEIVKAINIEGLLEKDTLGHGLLYFFYQKMISLLANLEIMCKLTRRNFQTPIIPEVIYGSLKVPGVSAFRHLESGFESHIQFSTFTDVETLASINCESLMRLAACLSFIKSIELDKSQQLKLSEIFTDLILSSNYLHNSLKSYLVEYEEALERLESKQEDELETSSPNQFSRETRILKQYKSIESKTTQFSDQMKILGNLAETLAEAENSEDSTELKDVIISKQAEAELTLRSLVTLFEAQTMLVHRLGQTIPTKVQPQPPPTMPDVDDCLARIGSCIEDSEESSHATVEFKTVATDECEEIQEIGNSDEVFVGQLEDTDNNDLSSQCNDIDMEEKLVSKLYSGVVTQLREALKPVKTKMKERERVALKKTYGSDVDSEGDSDEDSEIPTIPVKFEDDTLKSISEKSFVNKYRSGSDAVEETSPQLETGPTSFANPFMNELRSKLNTGLGVVGYMNASEEESFSDSGDDDDEDE